MTAQASQLKCLPVSRAAEALRAINRSAAAAMVCLWIAIAAVPAGSAGCPGGCRSEGAESQRMLNAL